MSELKKLVKNAADVVKEVTNMEIDACLIVFFIMQTKLSYWFDSDANEEEGVSGLQTVFTRSTKTHFQILKKIKASSEPIPTKSKIKSELQTSSGIEEKLTNNDNNCQQIHERKELELINRRVDKV